MSGFGAEAAEAKSLRGKRVAAMPNPAPMKLSRAGDDGTDCHDACCTAKKWRLRCKTVG